MINEITVNAAIKSIIIANINQYAAMFDTQQLMTEIKPGQVYLAYPDPLKISKNEEIYIYPTGSTLNTQTFCNDMTEEAVEIYIMTKQDSDEHLLYKASVIENAIIKLLQEHRTLNGNAVTLDIVDTSVYPSVQPTTTITCIKINFTVQFIRSFN